MRLLMFREGPGRHLGVLAAGGAEVIDLAAAAAATGGPAPPADLLTLIDEGAEARGREIAPPTVFTKAITTIAGPNADIAIDPAVSEQIDWEVELGVVIGRRGIDIARERALDHVFGYTV